MTFSEKKLLKELIRQFPPPQEESDLLLAAWKVGLVYEQEEELVEKLRKILQVEQVE